MLKQVGAQVTITFTIEQVDHGVFGGPVKCVVIALGQINLIAAVFL